jgi:mercuric ion transport protein
MNEKFSQYGGLFGAAITAACCLGITVVLSAVAAVGLGFLINDAYLLPMFVGFTGLNLWTLYRSARKHEALSGEAMLAFWIGSIGALISIIGLGFTVTGILPVAVILVYIGLTLFVVANIWDFMIGRNSPAACADDECKTEDR